MKRNLTVAAIFTAIGLVAGFTSGKARADVITGSFTGTFSSGTIDTYGYVSAAGTNLSGEAFSVSLTYASSGSNIHDSGGAGGIQIINTTTSGDPFAESITVGTTTLSFTSVVGGTIGFYQSQQFLGFDVSGTSATPVITQINSFFGTSTPYAAGLLDSEAGFDTVLAGLEAPDGPPFGFQLAGYGGDQTEFLNIGAVTGTSAVPEPSSLALYGAALLGLGYFSRRRRA